MKHNKYLLISPDYPPPLVGGSLVYVHSLLQNCPESFDVLAAPIPEGLVEITDSRHDVTRSRFLVGSQEPSRWSLLLMYGYLVAWGVWHSIFGEYHAVILNVSVIGNSILVLLFRLFRVRVIGLAYAEELSTVLKGSTLKSIVKRKLMMGAYRHTDGFVVVCDFAEDVLSSIGVPPERITVIPPPLNESRVGRASKSKRGCHQVLSVGRLIPRKGFHCLIDAISVLRHEIPDIKLTIVGNGSEKKRLADLIGSSGLGEIVSIRGEVADKELRDLYSRCDLFVLANLMLSNGDCEGAPTVFVEANSHGVPVIGGVEGGAATMINHGENGFLVDPRNTEQLAGRMREILTDSDLRRKLGEGGLRKVAKDHDPRTAGLQFCEFVRKTACQ